VIFCALLVALSQVPGSMGEMSEEQKVNYLKRAAQERAEQTLASGSVGGKAWQEIMKTGDMPKMTITKKSWIPEALTTVPKGWRLGTKDQIQGAKERFLEKAKEEFDNYADKEQHRTEAGINRKEFVGNNVKTQFLGSGFVNILKKMAGSWGGSVHKATAARVEKYSDGVEHATHKKVTKKNVGTVPRPLGI